MALSEFAFDTVEAISRLNSPQLIAAELMQALPRLGFPSFALRETPAQTGDAQPKYLIDNTEPGWRELYVREGFYKIDHIVRYGRSATRPFAFESVPYSAAEAADVRRLLDAGASIAGMKSGIVIPMSSWRTRAPASAVLRCEPNKPAAVIRDAEMILVFATLHLRSLISPECVEAPRLSPREREVLQWTARGKTAWEIGEILRISEGVVSKFIANAMAKLDAVSKPQAVAKAIRCGEIDL